MTGDDFLKSLACLVAWREERSNQLNGMLAVLFVIRNRVQAGPAKGFGNNWGTVIEQHGQFSSMSILGDGQTVAYPDVRDATFNQLLQLVDDVYSGERVDNLTDGAYYYADLTSKAYDQHGWFARNIVGKPDEHPRCAQIGTTTYFK